MPSSNHDHKSGQRTTRLPGSKNCVHMWSIEPPNGPTSLGTCADCGDTKEFHNSVEMSYWDNKRKHVPENLPPKKGAAANAGNGGANTSAVKKPARQ